MRGLLLCTLLAFACSDEGEDLGPGSNDADVGVPDQPYGIEVPEPDIEACGPTRQIGAQCTFLDQCGTDPNRNPAQWVRESDQGRTGLCVAGECFDYGRLDQNSSALSGILILTDPHIRYGRSILGSVIAPQTDDGRALDCEDFLAIDGCDPSLDGVQVVNTTRLGLIGNQVDEAIRLTNNVPPGEWIFTVAIYSGGESRGRLVDYACEDGIEVDATGQVFVDGALSQAQDGTFAVQFEFSDRDFDG